MATKRAHTGIRIGDTLKNKYQILAQIGKGGMSRVYLANDKELTNKQWAVKEIDKNAKDPLGRPIEQSLECEADILSRLSHPSIVEIKDIVQTDDFFYIVMDHVEGDPLSKVVKEHGPQAEPDVQSWMMQVADALAYLHRQNPPIIYRDLKPNNIILNPDGYIKLIDLGVAREYKDEQQKDTIAYGTNGYAAPEQFGNAQSDARTDIYGLGATMWHLLAGKVPPMEFPLPNVRTENPNVGEGFADVIIPKCTALEREERYQNVGELMSDLEVYEDLTVAYRKKQRDHLNIFLALANTCLVLALAGGGCLFGRNNVITQNYDHYVQVADSEYRTDPETAEEQYLAAIKLMPEQIDPYLGLLNCYKADLEFTQAEKQQFDGIFNGNADRLRGPRFAELNYQIGRLYWYYYTYGQTGSYESNQNTRIKASAEYFNTAAQDAGFDKSKSAQTYYNIASFVSDVDAAVMDGSEDKELYLGFFGTLEQLYDDSVNEDLEIVKLDCAVLVANSIETYVGKFNTVSNISKSRIVALQDKVVGLLEQMELSTDANKALRDKTLDRLKREVANKIATAYSKSVIQGVD